MPSRHTRLLTRVGGLWIDRYRTIVKRILQAADAEHLVTFHDDSAYLDWALRGSLGMGESYMRGSWDSPELDVLLYRLLALPAREKRKVMRGPLDRLVTAPAKVFNLQTRSRAVQVADAHYNLSNDFFAAWLDDTMTYSCGYWDAAANLKQAQIAKQQLIADKLRLEPGMRVLEIGCGWGSFASFLHSRYGVHVDAVTISKEQHRYAMEHYGSAEGVRYLLGDYRDLSARGQYDRVVSVAMFEAVGLKNYVEFMRVAAEHLCPGGRFVLHTIGTNRSLRALPDRFIEKYIFPNGFLPSMAQITRACEGRFVLEHVENIGPNYDRTLLEWNEAFSRYAAGSLALSPEFVRMWRYYLLSTAAGFRARATQVWQMVWTEHGRAPRVISER